MLKIHVVFALIIVAANFAFGQLSDDFNDGNLTENPTWSGDVGDFLVSADAELQLNAPDAGQSHLFTPVTLADSVEWSFYLLMDFSPSASNMLEVHLAAESSDLANARSYFIRIGENGANDKLDLIYRDEMNVESVFFSGSIGNLGGDPAAARIRLSYDHGMWTVYADYLDGNGEQLEGMSFHDAFSLSNATVFGIMCTYTSTRADKFFFDDFLVQIPVPDLDGPEVLSVTFESLGDLKILFSEALEATTAENLANYSIASFGNPASAQYSNGDNEVLLTFSSSFVNNQDYELDVSGVFDLFGNAMKDTSLVFTFFVLDAAEPYDVIINEIFADPNPAIGLPEGEFIELFNRSQKTIDLLDFSVSSGSTPQRLTAYTLPPGGFVILCDEELISDFEPFGSVIGLPTFPPLTNSGDEISLLDSDGSTLHKVEYTQDWYRDIDKDDGGWTLEMINPNAVCRNAENWAASEDLNGGSPGVPNSVLDASAGLEAGQLLGVFPINPVTLRLSFSHAVDVNSASIVSNYDLNPALSIDRADVSLGSSEVILNLISPLQAGVIYTLSTHTGYLDCLGQTFGTRAMTFGLPEVPIEKDIVINEILFNPASGGVDFVEVYNRSTKIFDLSQFGIANLDGQTDIEDVFTERLIFPGDYIVFSALPSDILSRYNVPQVENLLSQPLPAFADKTGNVSWIYNGPNAASIIDSVDYNETYHFELIDDVNGLSLERVNPNGESQSADNWHSASSVSGYGTPTGENSQFMNFLNPNNVFFTAEPSTFSPNGDGFKDFLTVHIQPEQPGYIANVIVYDRNGRQVRRLVNNKLLGITNEFKWDGLDESKELVPLNIYLIYIELIDLEGNKHVGKLTCGVATKF